jgi:hypothetical protein
VRGSRLAVAAVEKSGGAVDARLENPDAPFSRAAAISGNMLIKSGASADFLAASEGDIGVGGE